MTEDKFAHLNLTPEEREFVEYHERMWDAFMWAKAKEAVKDMPADELYALLVPEEK